jgi:predicted dehydrogenase
MTAVDRRTFLASSAASVAGLSARSYARAADSPNGKVALAIIGIGSTVPGSVGGRGRQLIPSFAGFKDVDIPYLCDIDDSFFPFGQKLLAERQRPEARIEKDLRRVLQDKDVDAVVAAGGKFFYDDDQETPDTMTVTYDFPACTVTWDHRVWSKGTGSGAEVYGEHGTLVLGRDGWRVEKGIEASDQGDPKGQETEDSIHQRNFIDCIKNSSASTVRRPNADIEEGHKSTRLCHLGNIAFRTGRAVRFDARTETCLDDAEANRLLGRSYRDPFAVPKTV